MTGFTELDGSFRSLNDTLQHRLTIAYSQPVHDAWLGTLAHAAAIARAKERWDAMPDEDSRYAGVTTVLDAAAHQVSLTDGADDATLLTAINGANAALAALAGLVGS